MVTILQGDCRTLLPTLPDGSVHCCVTSPPYFGLRDYGCAGQIGIEKTPDAYVAELVAVFREVRRVLRDDGTLWLNLGDSYNGYMANQYGTGLETKRQAARKYIEPGAGLRYKGLKNKDLIGIPWRVAFALQADGWYLRQDIIWHKPNPMPESVTDRCTKAHEYIFLLSKSARYFYDSDAIAEPALYGDNGSTFDGPRDHAVHPNVGKVRRETVARGGFAGKTEALPGRNAFRAIKDTRNKRSVWTIPTGCYKGAHFATFPPALALPCVLAGCPAGGTVLDPFAGSGTVGEVAAGNGRCAILMDIVAANAALSRDRCGLFASSTRVPMDAEAYEEFGIKGN